MWNIKLSIRSCDICKEFSLESFAIYCEIVEKVQKEQF